MTELCYETIFTVKSNPNIKVLTVLQDSN